MLNVWLLLLSPPALGSSGARSLLLDEVVGAGTVTCGTLQMGWTAEMPEEMHSPIVQDYADCLCHTLSSWCGINMAWRALAGVSLDLDWVARFAKMSGTGRKVVSDFIHRDSESETEQCVCGLERDWCETAFS